MFFFLYYTVNMTFPLHVQGRDHGQGMDVQDTEAGHRFVFPGSCEKVCHRCEEASSESRSEAHPLSVQ
jgi:hypothetical protein